MEIDFREIDRTNWNQCVKLALADEQKDFVASNAFSLAQAAYEPNAQPRGIYRDDEMVGFLMWDYDDETDEWWMIRLMVDRKHQGCGIGKAAVTKLLNHIAETHGHVKFFTSAEPSNTVALALYESLGFCKNGRMEDGEIVLEIQL